MLGPGEMTNMNKIQSLYSRSTYFNPKDKK